MKFIASINNLYNQYPPQYWIGGLLIGLTSVLGIFLFNRLLSARATPHTPA